MTGDRSNINGTTATSLEMKNSKMKHFKSASFPILKNSKIKTRFKNEKIKKMKIPKTDELKN